MTKTLEVRKITDIQKIIKTRYECNQCGDIYSKEEAFLNRGNEYFCSKGCVLKWDKEHSI